VAVLGDLSAVFLGMLLPALLRFSWEDFEGLARSPGGAIFLSLSALVWVASLSGRGAYWPNVTVSRSTQLFRVSTAALLAWVFLQALAFWMKVPVPFESRLVAGLSLPVTVAGLAAFRLLLIRPLARRVYPRLGRGLLLVLGDTPRSMRLARDLQGIDRPGARLVVHYLLSTLDRQSAAAIVEDLDVGEVILDPDGRPGSEMMDLAFACFDAGAQVRLASADPRMIVRRPESGGVGGFPPMQLRRFDLSGPETLVKRILDLAGAAAGLMLLSPLFAILAVVVRMSSPGPAIYRSERVGRYGRTFHMYKFRTMADGNDSRENEVYLRAHIREGRPAEITEKGDRIYKSRNDPRVTPLGAWLRKLSLDELPQLYNVLRGEMSLVGPRPCLPYEWELYQPWQRRRLDVKPGCTGLWQVTGRSRVRFEDMVMLDLLYAHNCTLFGDLKLIAQTIPVMVQGKGAY
jgi:exopolysaccharide biosynthesis polyprenyl glycosylphosphotransferase